MELNEGVRFSSWKFLYTYKTVFYLRSNSPQLESTYLVYKNLGPSVIWTDESLKGMLREFSNFTFLF